MNWTKYIIRGILLLLVAIMAINLFKKTDDDISRIAKFKIETLNKIRTDSLDTQQKLDFLVEESTKFSKKLDEDSPQIQVALKYLIGIVGLLIAFEIGFFVSNRKKPSEVKNNNGAPTHFT